MYKKVLIISLYPFMCFIANNRPTYCNTSKIPEIISKFLKIVIFVIFYKIFDPGVGLQMFKRKKQRMFSLQLFVLRRQCGLPKWLYSPTSLHGVLTWNTKIWIFIDVRTKILLRIQFCLPIYSFISCKNDCEQHRLEPDFTTAFGVT